ncbi:zinc finger BED domain-containing protein RICESLEEPER 2-like protein [Tanacetum coccineum]
MIEVRCYQEEREEHVNVENVVELESNTEEKPKKTRATHTKIHGTSTLRGHLKFFPKFPENMLDGQTQLSIQKGDGDDRKMIARKFNQQSIRSHWGVDIGKAVEMCLLKWGIESNVFTIIVGNASAKDVVVVNLKSKKSVECVRAAVKYIKQSPQRLAKFKEYAEIEKCLSTKSLILDVPTCWNSTYLMLEATQKYERAFARYDSEDRHYRDDLGKTGMPISSDWANVRRLTKILEHFYELTLKVSGILYVTSNSFLDDITSIDAALNNCINGAPDTNLAAMAKIMKCKFDKYYGSLEKCNMAIVVTSVLDPRNKFEYVEVLLGDVYGKIKGKAMCAMIKASFVELYEDYVRIHASLETHTMFESIDPSSSTNKRSMIATLVIELSVILKQKVRCHTLPR